MEAATKEALLQAGGIALIVVPPALIGTFLNETCGFLFGLVWLPLVFLAAGGNSAGKFRA